MRKNIMSWPWHNSGDQRPVFICNVYSPKSRLLRRRAVTPPSAPAGSCWAANPSRSARLCSSSARSMVTKYYCSRSFVHIHSTAGLLLERGYAGKGMVQEDLLGLPHPQGRGWAGRASSTPAAWPPRCSSCRPRRTSASTVFNFAPKY